jgi:hypothetical protein
MQQWLPLKRRLPFKYMHGYPCVCFCIYLSSDATITATDVTYMHVYVYFRCNDGYHLDCLSPPLPYVPEGEWYCSGCISGVCVYAYMYIYTHANTHTHTHTHINTHTYIHTRTHAHTHTHTYIAMRDHERRGAALMRSIGSSSPFANENGASQPTPGAEKRAQSASSKPHPIDNKFYSQEASTASRGRSKV